MFGAHRRWDEDLLVGVAFGDTIGYVGSNEEGGDVADVKLFYDSHWYFVSTFDFH